MGKLERAESCFRQALAVDPRLRAARENLAGVLYAMGRLAEESPWFPGFRIYRETAAAGWASALAQLGRDLAAALAAEHRSAAVHD
jgi:hypothetical protein